MVKPGPLRSAAVYGSALLLCIAFMVRVFKLWQMHLNVPLGYGGDALLTCMWIKGIAEHGWYLNNPSLGAPGAQVMLDYPLGDTLHLALLKLLLFVFSGSYGAAINVYYLLGYPATTLTALFVFRRCGFSSVCGILGSLLYTFLPYHYLRGEAHLFLGEYYLIPLAVLMLLWVYSDDQTLLTWEGIRPKWGSRKRLLFCLLLCLLLATTGFYYALFTVFFLLVTGVAASWNQHRVQPLATAVVLTMVLLVSTFANTIPNQLYWHTHGKNAVATRRWPADVEAYGLTVSQLLLPVTGHRVHSLESVKSTYNQYMLPQLLTENNTETLGFVASCGFLILLGSLFASQKVSLLPKLEPLSRLNLAAILLASIGSFNAILAVLVPPLIRAYNRISIFIAFFSMIAIISCLNALCRSQAPTARSRWTFYGLIGLILIVGMLDQTTYLYNPKYVETAEIFQQDGRFVARIESSLPSGAMIFQLPYVPFPESRPVNEMYDYEHLRGYLHSHTLRWSYGTMKGREIDAWQWQVTHLPLPEMVRQLAAAGFQGIYIDRDGYDLRQDTLLETALARLLQTRPLESEDHRLAFYSLAHYRAASPAQPAEIPTKGDAVAAKG